MFLFCHCGFQTYPTSLKPVKLKIKPGLLFKVVNLFNMCVCLHVCMVFEIEREREREREGERERERFTVKVKERR